MKGKALGMGKLELSVRSVQGMSLQETYPLTSACEADQSHVSARVASAVVLKSSSKSVTVPAFAARGISIATFIQPSQNAKAIRGQTFG